MNNKTHSDEPVLNADYASQWIEYLKKKNTILNIIWPLLLVSTILCAVAVFYFFQLSQSSDQRHKLVGQKILNVQSELKISQGKTKSIEAELLKSQLEKKSLQEDMSLLVTAKTTLEQQKGDSVSQLDLSSQIVATLKENVSALISEKELVMTSLNKAKTLLLMQAKNNQIELDDFASQSKENAKARFNLQKKLNDRKVAFEALMNRQKEMQVEMNRLADLVQKQQSDMDADSKDKKAIEKKLQESQAAVETLQNEYSVLQKNLKLVVAPISAPSAKAKPKPAVSAAENKVSANDGLDEIRAPVTVKKPKAKNNKSNSGAAFDFNQISLDNP